MKLYLIILIAIFFASCSARPKKLEDKEQTLDLHYISWACDCANWVTGADIDRYESKDSLEYHGIFIEPSNANLKLSDTLGYSGDVVRFTGRFYIDKGFPENYVTQEKVNKAKVFEYTSFEVLKSNYHENIVGLKENPDSLRFNVNKGGLTGRTITITVNFGAIECTCPQWFETKNTNDTINERQYFYLEQGQEGIINADTLYNGKNYPIQLSVTGQFYNNVGYPKNYNPTKGDPKPARVFKYDKVKIVGIN